MVAPNNPSACTHGNFCWCSGNESSPGSRRELIIDPTTGRGFVFSTDQFSKGRAEFLFLDTPASQIFMVRCSKIISNYDQASEAPENLEVMEKDPFDEGLVLSFVARVLDKDAALTKMLQRNYLYHKPTDIVVMIPIMRGGEIGEAWGVGNVPLPSPGYTNASLDNWIQAETFQGKEGVQQFIKGADSEMHQATG